MRFLITAGGTREHIDPVRFISNASSGRMGYALARAAVKAGHEVTLVTAATTLRAPAGVEVVAVETAAQMFAAVKESFGSCDCLIMAAAVADYTPAAVSRVKLKKQAQRLRIELKPTADILAWAGRNKRPGQVVVGFALEDREVRLAAQDKLRKKKLDMIVANTPAAIGSDRSTIEIMTADGRWTVLSNASKSVSSRRIVRLSQDLHASKMR